MSTRSGGAATTVRESASRRYSTPKGSEKAPTLTASGKRVGRPPKGAAPKAAPESVHERSARLQREGHLPAEAQPGAKLVGQRVAGVRFDPHQAFDIHRVHAVYGNTQLGAALQGYSHETLKTAARNLGIQPGRSNAETISRLTAHLTQGRYSANFPKTTARVATSRSRSEGMKTRPARTSTSQPETKLVPIARVSAKFNPHQAFDPQFVRAVYGDRQLPAALHGYAHETLKRAAREMGVTPGRSRADTIQRMVTEMMKAPYEVTLKRFDGTHI